MSASRNGLHGIKFGPFTLNFSSGALLRGDAELKLRPKSYEVLSYLVENQGRLISKHELLTAIWGSTIVTDGSITQCLVDIRRALDDHDQRIIRTVSRRGYIFDAAVEEIREHASDPQPPDYNEKNPLTAAIARQHRDRRNSDKVQNRNQAKMHWQLKLAFGAAFLVAASLAGWKWSIPDPPITLAEPPAGSPPSIAILPFVDLSPGRDHEYLSDGIAEEILNALTQTSGLRVVARSSSFSFRGSQDDVATLARQLKVGYLLEGSLRKEGNRLRVAVQLINASDNTQVWSNVYERTLDDVFAVQEEIASSVAGALKLNIESATPRSTERPRPSAQEAFMQARFLYERRGPEDLQRALVHFQHALDLDPGYARAWAGLAGVYSAQIAVGLIDEKEGRILQQRAVDRALALDPKLAEAHIRAAGLHAANGDLNSAIEHRRLARVLEPDNPLVLSTSAGIEAMFGNLDQAVASSRLALELDPLSAVTRGNLISYLLSAGRVDEAKVEYLKLVELSPDSLLNEDSFPATFAILDRQFDDAIAIVSSWPAGGPRDQAIALIGAHAGELKEADAALDRLIDSDSLDNRVRLAEIYGYRGEVDEAFRWINAAASLLNSRPWIGENATHWWQLRNSPYLRTLHADPRWQKWMQDSGPDLPGSSAINESQNVDESRN